MAHAIVNPAWMNPNTIRFVTIHCAATPAGRAHTAAEVTQWDIERFGQPSYHYVVELDGKTTQTLRHDQRGAHTAGANTSNIGICYVGGMNAAMTKPMDTRTVKQTAAIVKILRDIKAKHPNVIIRGHNEWPHVAKACPSFSVKSWLKTTTI